MAAPKGNQFWKIRSKHGRSKIFQTPEIMLEACCEYFEWCDKNPLIQVDFRGKDIEEVKLPKVRAYTIKGMSLFLGVSSVFFANFKSALKPDENDIDKEFYEVITRVEEIISNQKFTAAAAGFLDARIIARDLGLADKSNVNLSGEIKEKRVSKIIVEKVVKGNKNDK